MCHPPWCYHGNERKSILWQPCCVLAFQSVYFSWTMNLWIECIQCIKHLFVHLSNLSSENFLQNKINMCTMSHTNKWSIGIFWIYSQINQFSTLKKQFIHLTVYVLFINPYIILHRVNTLLHQKRQFSTLFFMLQFLLNLWTFLFLW